MPEQNNIEVLKKILDEQMELLRLCLYVSSQGPASFENEIINCSLSESKKKASILIAMGAGQSVVTILKMSNLRGIPVRDIYPIARSAIESFINAAFLISDSEEAAERAIKYVAYASWKNTNRTVGSGDFTLKINSTKEEKSPYPEFNGKGNGVWTKLDLPSRIRRIGEEAGKKAGSRFLGAYALIYSLSSEIIHGSPYGVNYFYQAHLSENHDVENFRVGTAKQIEDVLTAVIHGAAGYLATFFKLQDMNNLFRAEQNLFNRFLQTEGVEPQGLES